MGFLVSQHAANCQKNSRRLELSISKNTPHGRWGQGPGSVDPRFPAGLPFPVPEIPEFVAFRDSGNIFQQFSRDFPGVFPENPRTDPGNSHSLLEFSEIGCDTPSPFSERFPLGEHAKGRCDNPPPSKGYLSDTCAIHYENKANGCDTPLCDTISQGYCAIWGGYLALDR